LKQAIPTTFPFPPHFGCLYPFPASILLPHYRSISSPPLDPPLKHNRDCRVSPFSLFPLCKILPFQCISFSATIYREYALDGRKQSSSHTSIFSTEPAGWRTTSSSILLPRFPLRRLGFSCLSNFLYLRRTIEEISRPSSSSVREWILSDSEFFFHGRSLKTSLAFCVWPRFTDSQFL